MRPKVTLGKVWGIMVAVVLLTTVPIVHLTPDDSFLKKPALLGIIVISGLSAALVSILHVRRERLRRLEDRQALRLGEIYSRYYGDSGIPEATLIEAWKDVAEVLRLPAEKLRPTDRFDQELRPLSEWHFYDDHVQHLFAWITKLARRRGISVNVAEAQTLGELVTLVARIQMESSSTEPDQSHP